MYKLFSSRMFSAGLCAASLAFGLGAGGEAEASTTLDTGASGSTACCSFQINGANVQDYGQVFVVPTNGDDVLQSYSFQIKGFNAGSFDFASSVYAWNTATHALSGAALFTSGVQSSPAGNATQTYTFTTGGLNLTGGGAYIAVLQPTSGTGAAALVASAFSPGTGALFFGSFNSGSANAPSTWSGAGRDAAFTATFTGVAAPTPEPASWILMIMGMGGLGTALRRQRVTLPRQA